MENKTISEFATGDRIEGFYLIKSADCKTTNSNNKKYMDFNLGDKTGEINSKLWECDENTENMYKVNTIIKVRGTVLNWQNTMQLKIEKIRNTMPEDKVNPEDFVQTAPVDADEMYYEILRYVENMSNEDIKKIITEVLSDYEDKLKIYPAAKKNHHAIRSGLLYHTTTMLHGAEKLSEIYTFLNKDLLYGGVILHDMAKIEEMNSSDIGIVLEYSVEGQLLGHITQGVKMVENYGNKVNANKEVVMLLQHMILSHHYEPEYGSPVKPMIPEGEVLHYLDIMDARMYDMKKALLDTAPGEFSDRIYSLENRRIYKPNTF